MWCEHVSQKGEFLRSSLVAVLSEVFYSPLVSISQAHLKGEQIIKSLTDQKIWTPPEG